MSSSNGHAGPTDGTVGPYRRIDTRTRRRAGVVYLVMAGVAAWVVIAIGLPAMWATAVVPIVVLAVYQFVAAWPISVSDMQAIDIASAAASFDVGHGSATLGYRGPLAKPVWQVLVFSNTASPDREALITVDALDGRVTGRFEQAVDQP